MDSGEAAPHLSTSAPQHLQLVACLEPLPPPPKLPPLTGMWSVGGGRTPARLMEIQGPGATAASIIFDQELASAKSGEQGNTK